MPLRKKRKIGISKDESSGPGLMIFLRRFYKPLVAAACLIVFFFAYNTYIVDRSLMDIQFALAQTEQAKSLDDIKGLNMILNPLIQKEVLNNNINSEDVINLDFASNITQKAEIPEQLGDIKFALTQVFNKKKAHRNRILVILDDIKTRVIDIGENARSALVKSMTRGVIIPSPEEETLHAAEDLQQKNEFAKAIKVYEGILNKEPRYKGMANVYLGYLYERFENFDKAKIIYEEIIKGAPGSQAAGFARRFLDDMPDVRRLIQKKKLLEEGIPRERSQEKLQQLYYQLASVKDLLANFESAEQDYRKVVDLGPKTDIGQRAKFNLGFNYKMQGKYADSENVFGQFSQEFPQNKLAADTYYWTADTLRAQGKYEEALLKYEEAASRFKNTPVAPVSLFRAGYTCLYDLRDPERAKKYFDMLGREFKTSDITGYVLTKDYINMANIYRESGFKFILQGKFEEAEQNFKEAIKFNPSDSRSYGGLGSVKALKENYEEGVGDAKTGIELAPYDSYGYANLGFMYILKNDFTAALKSYKEAVNADPAYAEAQYNIGWLYQNALQDNKAMDAYKNAIKSDPDIAVAHNNLGVCLWKNTKFEEASNEFITAVQLDKNLVEAHYNLGIVHFVLGRFKQAEAELSVVIATKENFADAKQLLDIVRQKIKKEEGM